MKKFTKMNTRARYCCVKGCPHFTGTTDKEIKMFRFPKDDEQRKLWINALNIGTKGGNNTNFGGVGFICSRHFSSTDIQQTSTRIQLKKGSIPMRNTLQDSSMNEIDHANDDSPHIELSETNDSTQNRIPQMVNNENCKNCSSLVSEHDELKKLLFKQRMDYEMKILKKDDEIEKLLQKSQAQSDTIVALKTKIAILEKSNLVHISQIDDLRAQNLDRMNVLNIDADQIREIVDCLVNGILPTQKYPVNVRQFALSMHYHSPRGYEFLRQTFNNNLPHNSTIRKWYANSNINELPGITESSLEYLKRKVAEKKEAGSELVCDVSFDETSTRKQVIWDPNLGQMMGYVTYGCNDEDDPLVAREAIVFIVSGLNEKFRIPIAYHFVNSLDASQKAELVKSVLIALIEIGVEITNITFDGHSTNKKLCKILGANLNIFSKSFQPYFTINGKRIHVMFDICHMEKLVRGWLDKKKVLYDANSDSIKWDFIVQLVRFSQEKGFCLTHKLNQSHLEWRQRPMHVRTAIETLSKSTADSIEFLRDEGCKEFIDSTATVQFIRLFDDLFDIFNTKLVNDNSNEFKNALCSENKEAVFKRLDEAVDYIKQLTFREDAGEVKNLCRSDARTGFIGIVIDIYTLKAIYKDLVEDKQLLTSIPTYYLNQDAVEMFFGKVRSRGGFNDNPNVVQFTAAYRKLLGNDLIFTSRKGNCEAFESNTDPFSDILYVSSRRDKLSQFNDDIENEDELVMTAEMEALYQKLADIERSIGSSLTDDLQKYMIGYIATLVEQKIMITDNCKHCKNVIQTCTKVEKAYVSSKCKQLPCLSTFNICEEADRFLKLRLLKGNINFRTIYYSIINNIPIEEIFCESDFSEHPEHKLYLIRAIIDGYIRIKGTFMARTATQELHAKKFRYKFKKLIHFYGQ